MLVTPRSVARRVDEHPRHDGQPQVHLSGNSGITMRSILFPSRSFLIVDE